MKRTPFLIALSLLVSLLLGACGASEPERNTTGDSLRDLLGGAQEITLKKHALSIGNEWDVVVKGDKVGKVLGKDLKVFGEVYVLQANNGDLLGGEQEKIFSIPRTAKFFDSQQREVGTMKAKLLTFLAEYTLKAKDGSKLATMKQKFGMSFKGEVKDPAGDLAWKMSRSMVEISPKVKIERKNGKVDPVQTILLAVAASDIYDAGNK